MRRLEEALGLTPGAFDLEPEMRAAMEALYQKARTQPADILFLTNWQIILHAQKKSIGFLCFTGPPNEQQEVEIGYTITEAFRNNGFGTEAVCAVTDWALRQPRVKSVLANTERGNIASEKLLTRCGYVQFYENESYYFWKKTE
jgi:RimJ/RimL family protein N-acetyltransferase